MAAWWRATRARTLLVAADDAREGRRRAIEMNAVLLDIALARGRQQPTPTSTSAREVTPSLEDVFIELIGPASDRHGAGAAATREDL